MLGWRECGEKELVREREREREREKTKVIHNANSVQLDVPWLFS